MRINEIFYSLQGEGVHAGKPAVFLRLAGCNLRCVWCDTKYAWTTKNSKKTSVKEVLARLNRYPCRHLVITGGEPLLQLPKIVELVKNLKRTGWFIEIETNSTIAPGGLSRHVQFNVSPKLKNSLPQRSFLRKGVNSFFKFVVQDPRDVVEANRLTTKYRIDKERVILMPQAANQKELQERSGVVAGLAKRYGFRFSGRLQVACSFR